MGEETERLAAEHHLRRDELDEIAFLSQRRAAEATLKGWFKKEIAPLEVTTRTGTQVVDMDEGIRSDTTVKAQAALRPAFRPDGLLTAGNSSQMSDGAAALVLASSQALERHRRRPVAPGRGGTWAAGD